MAIDKETNKAVGGGGIEIESSDNSITISDAGKNTKDIKVNWDEMPEPEETDVKSTDGTISVEQSGQTFDLSVPLATEQRNGLLSAVGKYQNDHAQLIETEEVSNTANIAAGKLYGKDFEFYPENGQMMTWKDANGDLHLSRYEPNTERNNGFRKANWRTAVYDSTEKTIIVESKSGESSETTAGQFLVSRTDNDGWTWAEYFDSLSPVENWGNGYSYAGTTVFISRNSSQEIEYSTDSGITWTRAVLPQDTQWTSLWVDELGRWCFRNANNIVVATTDFSNYTDVSADYPANCRCYFLPANPARYADANKISNWMCMCRETFFGISQNVLRVKRAGGWEQYHAVGSGQTLTRHFPIKIQLEDPSGDISIVDADLFFNEEDNQTTIFLYIDGSHYYDMYCNDNTRWFYPHRISDKNRKVYGFLSTGDSIYKAEGTYPLSGGLTIESTSAIFSGVEAVNILPYDGDKIFTFGGVKYDGSGFTLSDFKMFITIDGLDAIATPPDFWREIPLLDENKNGLIKQSGNSVQTVSVGDFLEERDNGGVLELGTVHSDRITPYANYLMRNSNGECWCMVDVVDMVDNTTKVYSDEECTDEIGTVTNHSYNPNNPLDVEVSIDGNTQVFVIDQSKIPQSLATTAAIIEALKKKVDVGNGIYFKANGTGPWVAVVYSWNTDHYEAAPATNPGFIVAITADGQEPANDLSNIYALYQWTAGSSFGIRAAANFTTEAHGDAPIYIEL